MSVCLSTDITNIRTPPPRKHTLLPHTFPPYPFTVYPSLSFAVAGINGGPTDDEQIVALQTLSLSIAVA